MFKNFVVVTALLTSAALCLPRVSMAEPICDLNETVSVYWAKDANSRGQWYSAKVLKVNEDGSRCYVRYAGFDSSWDEWVGRDRLKRVDGRTPLVNVAPQQQNQARSQAPAVEYQISKLNHGNYDLIFVKVRKSIIVAQQIGQYYSRLEACVQRANLVGHTVVVSDDDGSFRYYSPKVSASVFQDLEMSAINSNISTSIRCNL